MKRKLFIAAIVCLTFLTLLMVSGCKMVYLNSSRLEMIAAVTKELSPRTPRSSRISE